VWALTSVAYVWAVTSVTYMWAVTSVTYVLAVTSVTYVFHVGHYDFISKGCPSNGHPTGIMGEWPLWHYQPFIPLMWKPETLKGS